MSERCTKIVATIGPASWDEVTLQELLLAGVNVARLNFSHGSHEDHARTISLLRSLAYRLGLSLCILQDLQGPKIRTGELRGGSIHLQAGQPLILTTQVVEGDVHRVSVDFPALPQSVAVGGRILLDDGNLELLVTAIHGQQVETQVVTGGLLKPHKGINLPGAHLSISALTEKDRLDLAFGLAHGVDMIALSFVRTAGDILELRGQINALAPKYSNTPIIAKLERPEALDNLEAIVQTVDGVMVARGDLGVEMSPESVPIAQKRIIECANRHGKLVITATQMLDSMIHNPRPTRAEASDVANAIFDGTDAVMLSGETASGSYPLRSVQTMASIIQTAEEHLEQWGRNSQADAPELMADDTYFLTRAARELAHDRNVAAVATFTNSGRTALLMSKTRPGVSILAFTPNEMTYHRMSLYRGVRPHLVPHVDTIEEMLRVVEEAIVKCSPVLPGQQVVLICGFPVGEVRPTNLALLHTVGG